MSKAKPLVTNAADEEQVKGASDRVQSQRDLELSDLRVVLSTPHGRRLIWRLMGYCKVFESVHDLSDGQVHYNSGQQDVGHFLMAEIIKADQQLLFFMMKENADAEEAQDLLPDPGRK